MHLKQNYNSDNEASDITLTSRQKNILESLQLRFNDRIKQKVDENRKNFFQTNFKRKSLPGEKSIPLSTFQLEIQKMN